MDFKDYYQTLGIQRGASPEQIKSAYRRLARKYHPDVSKEADAEMRFKEINEAYEVLKDPDRRATYDRFGRQWRETGGRANGGAYRPPPGWERNFQFRQSGGASGFSDFFESLFGATARRGGGFVQAAAPTDPPINIEIELEDSFRGASRQITLQKPQRLAGGRLRTQPRNLNVKIPKGITAGQKIRLGGQGAGGADLLLEVSFRPHPLYTAEGRDITLQLPITPWEAALGHTVTVPTLAGKVELKIHPGAQSGQKLRLKGRGLPGADAPGDQYVVLKILTPTADTEQARALYRRMAAELPFDPRADLGS